ncbi:DUF4824 family protein [Gilvimarinus polysaccharolyticus]|uniref:DUF4824 family protein n=1 Tax=Gilvimarinus polysaccharolyticus TaxID=863921 RepID=UPI0006733439|nr:DUF4824 family protein [Gilvimarinus polysaccharolyticus]
MKTKKILVLLSFGVIILVNGIILAKVIFNRSEVVTQISLSERELELPYRYGFKSEDSSLRLSLQWRTPAAEPLSSDVKYYGWHSDRALTLSDVHFFSFQFPSCSNDNHRRHKKSAWVLAEFNGPSYARHVQRVEQYHALIHSLVAEENTESSQKELNNKRKYAADMFNAAKNTDSRLFIIDAAAERELLEAALEELKPVGTATYMIIPAEVQNGYYRCDNKPQKANSIRVNKLAVNSLYVPKDLAVTLAPSKDSSKVNFEAMINYGRLYEPWLSKLEQ